MSVAETTIGITIVTIAAAGAIGYGLFKLINLKGEAVFPNEFGRKWFAWAVFLSTLTVLPKFLRQWDMDSFTAWPLAIVVFGGAAYVIGWIIGKYKSTGAPPKVTGAEPDSGVAARSGELVKEDNRPVDTINESPALTEEMNEDDKKTYFDLELKGAPEILSENALYEIAWKETEMDKADAGLWAKAYSICDGEKEKTRAYYIRERVKNLHQTQSRQLQEYKEKKKKEG